MPTPLPSPLGFHPLRLALLPALLGASGLVGCSPTQAPLTPQAPHGGMIFDLPGGAGSVEVVRRLIADQPGRIRPCLYYLDAAMNPMTPPPTVATLKFRGRKGGSVEFQPPSTQAGMLEGPNMPDAGDIEGELTATVDGKPAAVSISVR